MGFEAVVIGTSAGGLEALKTILSGLPEDFALPVAIVQHRGERADSFLAEYLNKISYLEVQEAEDKQPLQPGHAYIAPGGYHLLIEPDATFSLAIDERVNYSCPSIDVLFESAADTYRNALIGMVLTGGNADGANGLKTIKQRGGIAIVQTPETAEAPAMPTAALAATNVDYVTELRDMPQLLARLSNRKEPQDGSGR